VVLTVDGQTHVQSFAVEGASIEGGGAGAGDDDDGDGDGG
jgi:hypothetical protein